MDNKKLQELQFAEQQLSSLHSSLQQLQHQEIEIDSALDALQTSEDAYEIIGTVMIKKSSSDLQKSLKEKKSFTQKRKKIFEQQEQNLRDQVKKLQEVVLEELDKQQK
ncbi:MAG: prefoldin subunit [Candidatus Nanoarchaeia archaeon]